MMKKSEAAKKLLTLTKIVQTLNAAWREAGQAGNIILSSDNITVTEKEVVLKFTAVMTVKISKDSVDMSSLEAVSPAVSRAINPE